MRTFSVQYWKCSTSIIFYLYFMMYYVTSNSNMILAWKINLFSFMLFCSRTSMRISWDFRKIVSNFQRRTDTNNANIIYTTKYFVIKTLKITEQKQNLPNLLTERTPDFNVCGDKGRKCHLYWKDSFIVMFSN